jgi:hypothetical protein
LIFGAVGLGKAHTGAGYGGLALAGLILGLMASITATHTAWNYYRVVHAIDRQIAAQASVPVVDANPATDQVRITSCYRGVAGAPSAEGTVVNEARVRRTLKVTVAFHVGRSTVFGYGISDPIDPGEQANWFARDTNASFTPTSCTPAAPPHPIP